MFARLRQGYGGQAGKDGRIILTHLLCCAGLAASLAYASKRRGGMLIQLRPLRLTEAANLARE